MSWGRTASENFPYQLEQGLVGFIGLDELKNVNKKAVEQLAGALRSFGTDIYCFTQLDTSKKHIDTLAREVPTFYQLQIPLNKKRLEFYNCNIITS